jgi:hypothetical protein
MAAEPEIHEKSRKRTAVFAGVPKMAVAKNSSAASLPDLPPYTASPDLTFARVLP